MTTRTSAWTPALVAGVIGALSVVTLALAWVNHEDPSRFIAGNQANMWLAGLAFGVVAALVLRDRPDNRLGPIFAVASLLESVCAAAAELAKYGFRTGALPGMDLIAWVGSVLWMPGFLLLLVAVPLLFPSGRLASPRWRWPAAVALAGWIVAVLGYATTNASVRDAFPRADNPFDLPFPDDPQLMVALAGFFTVVAVGVAAIVALVLRMRRLGQPERAQHAWFVAGVVLVLAVSELHLPDLATFVGNALAIVAFGIGIVRHQLFDIEVVLSRAVVYAVLTAGALAAYLLAATLLGARTDAGVGPAVVAAVVALLLAGVRQRVQRVVDHLLYGERRDPLEVLTDLGERLSQALDADAVLPAVVEAVRHTLRLPYAAVRLTGEDGPACESGEAPGRTAEFPLAHAGTPVGTLVVGLRRGETALSGADARVLDAFARQTGVAAHGVRVTRDLRRSRERLVVAREEERRRLRRDLHDGLGPALAGITLGLETAGRASAREESVVTPLLESLRVETAACVDEVKRIVADLRPPALDQIGLVAALRQHADLLTSRSAGRLQVDVAAAAPLPPLPAAVEVAAYRIALEAMTNTARHADAHTCTICVELNGSLHVTVRDDGSGVPARTPGVGLGSMRDRAEELGGECTVVFRQGEGTSVEATLPVESP
jgi:two-component system, NarL family, sensor kinase